MTAVPLAVSIRCKGTTQDSKTFQKVSTRRHGSSARSHFNPQVACHDMWLYAACWVTCSVGLLIFKHVFQVLIAKICLVGVVCSSMSTSFMWPAQRSRHVLASSGNQQSIDSRVHFKAALFSWSLSYQVDTPGARAFSAVRSSATTSWQNCRAVRCLLGAVRAWYIIGVIFMSVGLIFSTAALCVASTVQVARLLEWMAAQVHETAPTAPVPLADAEPAWFAPVVRPARGALLHSVCIFVCDP